MSERRLVVFEQIVKLSRKMLKIQVLDEQKAREELASLYEEYLELLEPDLKRTAIVILTRGKPIVIPRVDIPKVLRQGKKEYRHLIRLWSTE